MRHRLWLVWGIMALVSSPSAAEEFAELDDSYRATIRPLLQRFCLDCHSTAKREGELDLERFVSLAEVRGDPPVWQHVVEMLQQGEMPPEDAPQPTADQRRRLQEWADRVLRAEARANAGDPGPIVLRRLNGAEYTYTVRDLTGVDALQPAREFPLDSAAGEGFTNVGQALVMSPAMLTKYLDAAKEISQHAVLLPDGFRFSPAVTRPDWTNEALTRIRDFYRSFSDSRGGTEVNLQGIVFDTNSGGRLPVEKYLAATIDERDDLRAGRKSLAAVARERGLNAKYLEILWKSLEDDRPSLILDSVRASWRTASGPQAAQVAAEVQRWQQALWRFTSVGHIGKVNGPKSWQEPVQPLTDRQEIRLQLSPPAGRQELVFYLVTGDAGDGNPEDMAVWERPRLVAPGRPELLLRDVDRVMRGLTRRREQLFAVAARALAAAAQAEGSVEPLETAELARQHGLAEEQLVPWLEVLGIGGQVKLDHFTQPQRGAAGYAFVTGWGSPETPSIVANSSDQHVRIPGNMKPHGVCVHPSPTLAAAVAWQSPISGRVRIESRVLHAHPECGNGVTWLLELRRGGLRRTLAKGEAQGNQAAVHVVPEPLAIRPGDLISLLIGPRDGNHACDLTDLELVITGEGDPGREWSLTKDVSPDILAGNPHADRWGQAEVWHFYTEPWPSREAGTVFPSASLLARWQASEGQAERAELGAALQQLLANGPPATADKSHPDRVLYEQLSALGGPLLSAAWNDAARAVPAEDSGPHEGSWGLAASRFGTRNPEFPVDEASLWVSAPEVIEVRLPADLAAGTEFVTTARLHPQAGQEASVQFQAAGARPEHPPGLLTIHASETRSSGPWTSSNRGVAHETPIVVADQSAARRRIETAFEEFRFLFPIALCYTKIVPVDEVVTLTLFYREDTALQQLMLDERQLAELNRLWDELHYVSQDAPRLVHAFHQLMEYATQDADPKVFEPLRQPIYDRAAAFQQRLLETEPAHLNRLVAFAGQAYRRPLSSEEERELRSLYAQLRRQDLSHEEAFRLTLARVLVAPAFLYRAEKPGDEVQPVSDWELASRLSYFLWSSLPDDELRRCAAAGRLQEPQVLQAQARRMLADERIGRLSAEFTMQWLHLYDFARHDEKSERHFPTFAALRETMQEEALRFSTHLFQADASVLDLLDADYTFVNGALGEHYGLPALAGSPADWQRIEGLKRQGRGGILGMAAILAKQSGASRTSPILRGTWLSEVVLGEKLPKPPKNVPLLADQPPQGLTERQLIEQHSSDAACAKCHQRIDPYGFALEGFDAIGRRREKDAGGLPIDTKAVLPDGTPIEGLPGLRSYLLQQRREAFLGQFCRKLLGYALGRSVQLSDQPLLEEMQARLSAHGYCVSQAVEAIVLSDQFRKIRPAGREP